MTSLRIYLLLLVLSIGLSSASSMADEDRAGKIIIALAFPQRYNTPMENKPIMERPYKISGSIPIGIEKTVTQDEVGRKRYLVEYFMDDLLIYSTDGTNMDRSELPTFDFILDTAKYTDGPHRLTVNFWDENGPSAIGMRDIIIENSAATE